MEQRFDYDIFLSYRHKNLDSIITQKTFQFVESFRLPKALKRKGCSQSLPGYGGAARQPDFDGHH